VLWYNEKSEKLQDTSNKIIITFPKADPVKRNSTLIWRYTLEYADQSKQKRVLVTGYFKLNETFERVCKL